MDKQNMVVVIGLDGGTFDIIDPMLAHGELPHMGRLIRTGVRGPLRSVIPPLSGPAWVTFMTGQNPGKHGVVDFWERDFNSYESPVGRLISSGKCAGQTVWDYAGAAGLRVGMVTVPITYPAWQVNGFMLSGHLTAPEMDQRAAYPAELVERFGTRLNFPAAYRNGASKDVIMQEGPAMISYRGQVSLELLQEHPCDLFTLVLGPTDRAQHEFWRYLEPDCDPEDRRKYGRAIQEHYAKADEVIGRILQTAGEDVNVIIMSDHGGGSYPKRTFHVNRWLLERGMLGLRDDSGGGSPSLAPGALLHAVSRRLPAGMYTRLKSWAGRLLPQNAWLSLRQQYLHMHQVDWSQTKAYYVPLQAPAGGIMINLRDRQPQGVVAPGDEYENVRSAIIEGLSQVIDSTTGEPFVLEAHRREEVYSGDRQEVLPDIVFVMHAGYRGGYQLTGDIVAPTSPDLLARFAGDHTMDGIFIGAGPAFAQGIEVKGCRLIDLPPTIMHLVGLPVPSEMDGRVLVESLRPEYVAARDIVHETSTSSPLASVAHSYSDEEEKEVMERLAALGYLD